MFRRKTKLQFDWSKIEASAPGRFVLIGDYVDLEDKSAIAIAIDRRLKVTIRPHKEEGKLRLNLKDFNDTREWPTSLPIFTMTKLVAHYADHLTYESSMNKNFKPLLNTKYQSKLIAANNDTHSSHNTDCSDKASKTTQDNTIAPTGSTSLPSSSTHTTTATATTADTPSADADVNFKCVNLQSTDQLVDCEGHQTAQGEQKDRGQSSGVLFDGEQEVKDREQSSCFLFEDELTVARRDLSMSEHADAAVTAFFILYFALSDSFAGSTRPSIDVEVESQIPMCRGLGSSTAYAVAMCAALMKVYRVSAEPLEIVDWAQNIDMFYHFDTSNLHSAVVTYGGYVYYQGNRLKYCGIPHSLHLKALLIDSGIRRNPKCMTACYHEKAVERPEVATSALSTLNDLVTQTWRQMSDPQFKPSSISQQLRIAQDIWTKTFNIGHKKILDLCNLAQQSQLAVKQSLAGETVFLLYNESTDSDSLAQFQDNLSKSSYKFEEHDIMSLGLKVTVTTGTTRE